MNGWGIDDKPTVTREDLLAFFWWIAALVIVSAILVGMTAVER